MSGKLSDKEAALDAAGEKRSLWNHYLFHSSSLNDVLTEIETLGLKRLGVVTPDEFGPFSIKRLNDTDEIIAYDFEAYLVIKIFQESCESCGSSYGNPGTSYSLWTKASIQPFPDFGSFG